MVSELYENKAVLKKYGPKNMAKDYRYLRKPSTLKDRDQNRQKKRIKGKQRQKRKKKTLKKVFHFIFPEI